MENITEKWDIQLEFWKKEIGTIPPNTCPIIDNVIKQVKSSNSNLACLQRNSHRLSHEDLISEINSLDSVDVEWELEDLRSQNEKLRELGKFWYGNCKTAPDYLVECKTKNIGIFSHLFNFLKLNV